MPAKVFTATIASAADSATFDFGDHGFDRFGFFHSTFSTAADCHLHGSVDGENYYRMFERPANTATATLIGVTISSAMTQAWVEIPCYTRYLKVITTGAVTNGATCKIAAYGSLY